MSFLVICNNKPPAPAHLANKFMKIQILISTDSISPSPSLNPFRQTYPMSHTHTPGCLGLRFEADYHYCCMTSDYLIIHFQMLWY